jgi:hypothetical protein
MHPRGTETLTTKHIVLLVRERVLPSNGRFFRHAYLEQASPSDALLKPLGHNITAPDVIAQLHFLSFSDFGQSDSLSLSLLTSSSNALGPFGASIGRCKAGMA